MLKPKKALKKPSKKEVKEDKFVLTVLDLIDKLKENANQILIGVAVALVLFFGVNYFINQSETRNKEASIELARANSLLNEGQESQAALVLQNLIESYNDTKPAYIAKVKLARFYYSKDDLENAKRYFQQAIDEGNEIPFLYAASLSGYGDCLSKEKHFSEAAEYYKKAAEAIENNKDLKLGYELSVALSYLYANDKVKALEYIKQIKLDKFPSKIEEKKLAGLKSALSVALNQ
jgi:tetratricopeptide (TPR) repeat protein